MNRSKALETCLVLTTGFVLLFFIFEHKWLLQLAFAIGIVGILIKPLANYIAIAWFKLADALSFVVSKVVLGTLFFVFLLPISLLYRLSNTDKLRLKKQHKTLWTERNFTYKSADLKNIW